MTIEYLENAAIFVNSSTSSVPSGRNIRAQFRSQHVRALAFPKAQQGQFHVLDLGATDPGRIAEPTQKKRRKLAHHVQTQLTYPTSPRLSLHGESHVGPTVPRNLPDFCNMRLDPMDVLTVATFHIRRIAAVIVRNDPARLPDVLRCRQWACVSFALERVGKCPSLDSALICVATKLRQMTGSATSQQTVLATYSEALQQLQIALKDPSKNDQLDLLSTTQLLAIYEMLDSLDGSGWSKHIDGAASLIRPDLNHVLQRPEKAFMIIAPLFSDMLLDDRFEPAQSLPERWMFKTFSSSYHFLSPQQRNLMAILGQVVLLKLDAKPVLMDSSNVSIDYIFNLLDRAHLTRSQLRSGLLQDDLQIAAKVSTSGSFDILAMCLAGMVALDRLINALRPVEKRARESAQDKTSELCAQLLQLELGASDNAYPATDLMSAFALSSYQQQPGYAIVLPGKG